MGVTDPLLSDRLAVTSSCITTHMVTRASISLIARRMISNRAHALRAAHAAPVILDWDNLPLSSLFLKFSISKSVATVN